MDQRAANSPIGHSTRESRTRNGVRLVVAITIVLIVAMAFGLSIEYGHDMNLYQRGVLDAARGGVAGIVPPGEAEHHLARFVGIGVAGGVLLLCLAVLLIERLQRGEQARRRLMDESQRYFGRLESEVGERTRALSDARASLEMAQRVARLGTYDYDLATDRWTSSLVLDEILGIDAGFERTLSGWLSLIAAEDRESLRGYLAERVSSGEPFDRVYRICRASDGEMRWVHGRGAFVVDANDRPMQLVGSIQDVTYLRETEDALRASEARANLILDTVPEGMLVVNSAGVIVRHNLVALTMFGYRSDEMLGMPVDNLIPQPLRMHHEALRRSFDPRSGPRLVGKGRSLHGLRKDGSEFDVEVGLGPVTINGEPQVIVIVSDIRERLRSERDLMRYRQVMDTSGDMLVFVDADLRYGISNPAYAAQFHMTPEAIYGKALADVMPADMYAEVAGYLRRSLAGETLTYVSERHYQDGRHHVMEAEYRPFVTPEGIEGVVASLRDVTQRIEAEAALRDSELKAWAMLNTPFINVGLIDTDGNLVMINDTAMKQVAMDREAVLGKPFWEGPWFVHDRALIAQVYEAVQRAAGGEASRFESTSFRADGSVRHKDFIMQPILDENLRVVWIVAQSIDITERKLAQQALEAQQQRLEEMVVARTMELAQSEDKFRSLVEQSLVVIYIICDGQFAYVNPGFATMYGYDSPDEIIGRLDVMECVAPESRDLVRQKMRDRAEGRLNVARYRFVALRKDGSRFDVEVHGKGFIYQGRPAVIGVVADITEQRRLEQARESALVEAQRLAEARSAFLANMSHEIRTPLNAVLGLAQVGMRDSGGRKASSTFKRILDSGQTLLAVVNDVLDFTKIEAGKLTLENAPFVLGDVIDQAIGMVSVRAYGKGINLRVAEAPDLPVQFIGDSIRLVQVLTNLLANAVKFTEVGEVELRVSRRDDGRLLFCIKDTGIGMEAEHLGRLFRPFEQADGSTTRRFGGSGLGLSIVHRLVELMHGDIQVFSEPGKGSRFEVSLPTTAVSETVRGSSDGLVLLVGLAENRELQEALRSAGVNAQIASPADAVSQPARLLVLDAALAADVHYLSTVLLGNHKGSATVAVAVTPGGLALPSAVREQLLVLERPLRVRNIISLLQTRVSRDALEGGGQRLSGLSILVAEDSEINRMVLEEMLVGEGARLVCEENGLRALERLQADGAAAYHVVLTDVQMPEMDGYGLARKVREIAPSLPVVGLTAHAMAEERARCLAAGMVEHLSKPVDLDVLISTLRSVARDWPGGDGKVVAETASIPALPGVIDWARLNRSYASKPEFITRLLGVVLNAYRETPQELRRLAAEGNLDSIAFLAHTLKSSFGSLMADQARESALQAERAARAGTSDVQELTEVLAQNVERLLAEAQQRTPAA